MNKALVAFRALIIFYTKSWVFLAGVFVGWMMCFAWVLVLSYAPQVALSLIDGLH